MLHNQSTRQYRTITSIAAVACMAVASTAFGQSAAPTAKSAASAPAPTPVSTPAVALPTAQEIFAKAVTAAGGADLIRMQTSRTQTGTIEMKAQSLKGTVVVRSVAPDMLLIETDIPGFGKILQGVNGTVGWSIDPMRGASIMDKDELARVLRESSIEAELNPQTGCDAAQVLEQTNFAGSPCYKVNLKCAGDDSNRYYSVDSGHLVGTTALVKSQMGEIEVTTTYSDFAAFSGRTLAKVQNNAMMGQTQTMTISAIAFDPIDAAVFALPKEIQGLISATNKPASTTPAVPTTPTTPPAPAKPTKK